MKTVTIIKEKNCETCSGIFVLKRKDRPNQKFCSITCSVKNLQQREIVLKRAKVVTGSKRSDETKHKMSIAQTGKKRSHETRIKLSLLRKGTKLSEEHKRKIGQSHVGNKYNLGRKISEQTREKMRASAKKGCDSPVWVNGNYKKQDTRNDSAYQGWAKQIKKRDDWKCKINNEECCGRMEVHHILSWRDHPELRYEVNNGITLCHKHHPRKHDDETRLSPYFTSLIKSI